MGSALPLSYAWEAILPNDKGVGPGLLENWSRAECLHREFLTSCRLSFKNLKRLLTYDSVALTLHVPSCTHEEHIQILKAKQSENPQVNGALFHNGLGFAFGLRSPPLQIHIYIYPEYIHFKDSRKKK